MLDQVLGLFSTMPDHDLNLMRPGQRLHDVTMAVLREFPAVLEMERPGLVLVYGDTTTTMAATLAAFYARIPVGHVEAGLRTGNKYALFPEEINRRMTGAIADLHFAPTKESRENFGEGFERICRALAEIASLRPPVEILAPVHLNQRILCAGRLSNLHLIEPVDYLPFEYLYPKGAPNVETYEKLPVWEYFGFSAQGHFIEVGAFHPKCLSNAWLLERSAPVPDVRRILVVKLSAMGGVLHVLRAQSVVYN